VNVPTLVSGSVGSAGLLGSGVVEAFGGEESDWAVMKPLALTSSGNRSRAERLIWVLKLELSTEVGCEADPGGSAGWVSVRELGSVTWDSQFFVLFPTKVGSLGKIVFGVGLAISLGG